MKTRSVLCSCIWLLSAAPAAWSSNACSDRAVRTAADVTVSDGSFFRTESYFHARDGAAIRHIGESDRLIAVEGPLSWIRRDNHFETATADRARFALGHQFHALLLDFADIVDNLNPETRIDFRGSFRRATSGDNPYGGTVHLVQGDDPARPAGLLIEDPDFMPIVVQFLDWRDAGESVLPHLVRVDDGQRVFDYRFTDIDIAPASPLWFFDAVPAPALDAVQIYRLHRKLLVAHCLGDADMMAALSAPATIVASRGDLLHESREATREQFSGTFRRWDYRAYVDIEAPVIEVSQSGDLGWIAVNVRATGTATDSDHGFEDRWAWIMTVGKIDGKWLHTGNASNRAE